MDVAARPCATDPLILTEQQAAAFAAIRAFAVGDHGAAMMTLAGYAGTGKTTLVAKLVRDLADSLVIAIAAPTNKAVGVLREKIGDDSRVDYGSIHSFLGLRLREHESGRHECRPEGASTVHRYNLVIVDEASMLGRTLFAQIATQIRGTDTRILFVGDPAQLPPVDDSGEESPTFTRVQHRFLLTDIVRQAADSPIIGTSMAIRQAIEQGRRFAAADIAASLPPPPANVLLASGGRATAFNWALHDIREGHDTRILAFTNAAVIRYNRDIHCALYAGAEPFAVGETAMLNSGHDARVWRGPDHDPMQANKVALFNSEECTVLSVTPMPHPRHPEAGRAWRVVLRRDSGEHVVCWIAHDPIALNARISELFNRASALRAGLAARRDAALDDERKALVAQAWALRNGFADLRHVYAMTIHKSQGSTLHTAIVDLGDVDKMRGDFDYNRALYVATTRASERLAFVL